MIPRLCIMLCSVGVLALAPASAQAQRPNTSSNTGWVHVEMGAANYSEPGRHNFDTLESFLEQYVERNGSRGTVVINDIDERAAQITKEQMENFARSKGWNEMRFRVILGDMFAIQLPSNVTTIAIRNPSHEVLARHGAPGDIELQASEINRLASLARDGLMVTTFFEGDMRRLQEQGGLRSIQLGTADTFYRFPSGMVPSPYVYPTNFWIPPRGRSNSPNLLSFPLGTLETEPPLMARCPLHLL